MYKITAVVKFSVVGFSANCEEIFPIQNLLISNFNFESTNPKTIEIKLGPITQAIIADAFFLI